MANVNIKVGYTVDKAGLNEIKRQLADIQTEAKNANTFGKMTPELKEASNAAAQLEKILNSAWNSKLSQLDLNKVNTGIKNTYGNVEKLKAAFTQSGEAGTIAYNNFAKSVLETNLQFKQTSSTLDKMAITLKNTIRYGISSSIFNNLTNSVQKAYDYTVKLDTSLNDIRIVTGKSAEEMDNFAIRANKVAKDLGRSTKDFTEAALIYYQQGLSNEESQARAEVTMKAANVTGQSGREVSEQLTAVWNGYKVTADEAELYVDKLAAVAAGTAADLEELSVGMSKVASAASIMGVDVDQLNAQLATIVSVTRQAPESVGVALKTIYARMSDIQSGLDDETTLGHYTEKMAEYGVNVLDANNQLRDMGDVIEEIGNKWDTMSREQQVALSQTMAGTRQYNNLLSLFDNWDMYTDSLKMSATAAGTLQEQQDIYMESTKAHLEQLSTEAERTYDILFDQNAVNGMTDAMTVLLGVFNDWMSGVGGGLNSLTVLASGLANIFNKQIGSGISTMIQNMEASKNNLSAEQLKQEIANSYARNGIAIDLDSTNVTEQAKIAQRILDIKTALTQEEYNQLTALQKQIGEDAERIKYLEEYKNIGLEILDNENATINDYEERLSIEKDLLKEEEQRLSYLTREKNLYQKGLRDHNDTEGFRQALSDLGQKDTTTMEQFKVIEQARMDVIDKETLSQQEVQTIIEAQNQALESQQKTIERINQGLEGRQAEENNITEQLRNKQTLQQQQFDEIEAQKQRQIAIQQTVQGVTSLINLFMSLSGVVSTVFDDSLTGWEKFSRISTTLLMTLPMLITSFGAIKTLMPNLAISMGAVAAGTEAADLSFKQATISVLTFQTALGPLWLVLLGITAAITAVVAVGVSLYEAYNKDADAAKEATEAAREAQKAFEEVKTAANDLKTTISDYTDALKQLKDLKVGTEEYTDALESANEKAKELIETFGLYDEAYTQSGMILFKDNSLEDLQTRADNATKAAEAQKYSTQISANQAKLRSNQTDLRREIGLAFDPRGLVDDIFIPIANNALAIIDDFKGITDEQVSDIVNRLTKLKESDESAYIANTRNTEALEKWIQTEYQGNYEMQILSKSIGEQVTGFKNLIESTEQLTKANRYYIDQLNKAELENTYGQQLKGMSIDKYGRVDETKYQQMLDVLNNAPIQEQIKDMKAERRNIVTEADLDKGKTWSGEFAAAMAGTLGTNETDLNKYLDEQLRAFGVSESQVGKIKDNETLAREYAKVVLKMTEEQVNAMQFAKDKLEDAEGKEIVDVSNADERGAKRGAIFGTATAETADQSINEMAQNMTQAVLNLENQLQMSAIKAGEKYGTDFSMALLNALSDPEHKIDLSKVTGIDDDEAKQLANISQEEFMQMFGLSDETLKMVGDATIEQLYQSFKESAANHKWDIDEEIAASMENKSSDLEAFGSDLSKKKFAELEEDVRVYAKNLMEIAETSDEVADSLEHNSDAAVDFAFKVVKMNKAIETLADNIEDWKDIINNSAEYSQEYAEAMYDMKNALADVYDTEADYISHSFIKDHLSEIEEIAKGSETAIEDLKDSLSEEIVANIIVENRLEDNKDSLLAEFVSLREQAQDAMSGLVIGDDILVDDTNFVASLNQLIDDCNMTVQQANAVFSALGIEPTYETETVQQEQSITPTQTKHEVIAASTKTFTASDGTVTEVPEYTAIDTVTPLAPIKASVDVPVMAMAVNGKQPHISGIKKAPGGSFNNYSSQNRGGSSPGKSSGGGKSGGGGSGSTKKPDKMDPLEKEINRYHDVDIQLKNIKTDLDKLDKQRKKLFGKDLISNLNKRLDLLNKQIGTTSTKIGIAKGEAVELQNKLSGKGVSFNADGTIANYAQVYASQLNYVNSLINDYNNMSAEAQESYKDTVEKAKKDFDKFTKDLDRYDEVITDLIPGLEKDIQDAIDEKIDLQIEKFDMEIEIRLDLAEAERDWNDFKKKIIDEIEDDNILGNAMARLVDFSSYYKDDNTGIVQALRKQVDNTLAELNQMDNSGWSNVYGDNRTAALEDLKKYYEELMTNLEDVLELQKEIHESYIDMMDEAQEKFDEQIKSYEMISDLIDHDMQVISLVYGEESYGQLAKYYDQQQQNFNNQLDFQRQQVNFWRAQLDALDEGSDAWENAKEKWQDVVGELNDLIENSIENLQDKYLNAINLIFQNLNNKVTDSLGLDYIEEEWNLINENADQYLDTINSLYEVQKLENKYLDALDNTDSISAQRQLKEIMDEELADLRERDKLTEYDIERANKKYEIALKQIALQEAQQNKTKMRLRRDSQGNYRYEYTADGDQIGQLQDELNDMYNSLYNFDKARYQDNLNQMYDVWVEFQEKMAEAAQINDPVARSERELLLQNQYEQLINGLTEQNTTVRENLHESAFDDLARLYDVDVSNFQNMSDEEKEVLMGDLLPYWESGVQHMTEVFAGEDGFLGVCKDAFDQLHDATKDYEDGLDELENTGRIDFDSIGEGIDQNIERTQQLITDNNELINSYEQELSAINNVIGELDNLVDKYNAAKDAAIAATKAAYEYWSEQQRQAAAAANNANGGSGSGNSNSGSGNDSDSNSGSGSNGDGNLVIGETATYSGSYYYDSYGTSPSGSRYSGVTDGIVVDMITNNPYGIHIHSADGQYRDLGWIKKSQLSGYDTGGYTGEWGSDGRLALLHQKELVLNKEDTANMLNAIGIMRNITNMLGSSVLGKLAAATAGNLNTDVGGDTLEQNVHIDAQFPNVKDSREIEEALNNLVNMASMRANKR